MDTRDLDRFQRIIYLALKGVSERERKTEKDRRREREIVLLHVRYSYIRSNRIDAEHFIFKKYIKMPEFLFEAIYTSRHENRVTHDYQ